MTASKKPRKPIDIKIDTKHVDVEIHRDVKGNVKASIDTSIIDVEIEKNEAGLNVDIHLDDDKVYEFESNGTIHHLPKGKIWKVTGELARIFLKRGFGKLIK